MIGCCFERNSIILLGAPAPKFIYKIRVNLHPLIDSSGYIKFPDMNMLARTSLFSSGHLECLIDVLVTTCDLVPLEFVI